MLLTVFAADPPISVSTMPARLEALRLGPLTLKDAADVLLSAFVEKHVPILEYLRRAGVASEVDGITPRKVTPVELRTLAEDVAVRCLTHESKGKTLKRLCDAYPTVRGRIIQAVLGDHEVKMEALGETAPDGTAPWHARLARHMGGMVVSEEEGSDSEWEVAGEENEVEVEGEDEDEDMETEDSVSGDSEGEVWAGIAANAKAGKMKLPAHELGSIGLEPLTTMIRRDEQGGRGRRRYFPMMYGQSNQSSRIPQGEFSLFSPFFRYSWISIQRQILPRCRNGSRASLVRRAASQRHS